MADIFREVDEDVRRERAQQIWAKYGNLIVGVALLVVIAIGGWRGYQWWEAKKAAEAGAVFESAAALASQGKHAEAEAAFARIAADGNAGYRVLARLREAAEKATQNREAAVSIYDAVAGDPTLGAPVQDLARLKAALLIADTSSYADVSARLEPIAAPARPFRHTARELLAFAAWKAGDASASRKWADTILTDPETPAGIRSRLEVLQALAAPEAKG